MTDYSDLEGTEKYLKIRGTGGSVIVHCRRIPKQRLRISNITEDGMPIHPILIELIGLEYTNPMGVRHAVVSAMSRVSRAKSREMELLVAELNSATTRILDDGGEFHHHLVETFLLSISNTSPLYKVVLDAYSILMHLVKSDATHDAMSCITKSIIDTTVDELKTLGYENGPFKELLYGIIKDGTASQC